MGAWMHPLFWDEMPQKWRKSRISPDFLELPFTDTVMLFKIGFQYYRRFLENAYRESARTRLSACGHAGSSLAYIWR